MKCKAIGAILCALVAGSGYAQSGGMKGTDMKDMPTKGMDMKKDAQGSVHKATGVVTKVDKNKVTIKHGPVQSMNWPAMSMTFTVKDKSLLDKMAKEKKVDFEFTQEGPEHVITAVK
jgi:Cu(I)/Ag(I) efflux system protein CusF